MSRSSAELYSNERIKKSTDMQDQYSWTNTQSHGAFSQIFYGFIVEIVRHIGLEGTVL